MKSLLSFLLILCVGRAFAESVPTVGDVELQPLVAQVQRVVQAMDDLGSPFDDQTISGLRAASVKTNAQEATAQIQRLLDSHCLFDVQINPESRVKVVPGPAAPELVEQGWRHFLVKVQNDAGLTTALRVESPNAKPLAGSSSDQVQDRWLDLMMCNSPPLQTNLSGLKLEYRIVVLYSKDAGRREAKFVFDAGQGAQDPAYGNEANVLFNCHQAQPITLRILDENNQPTTGAFIIRDKTGRIYPSQAKRLAPDFAFQKQIYRTNGEVIRLPEGVYRIEFSRGPESLRQERVVVVEDRPQTIPFTVRRWIDPAALGWWSGDHHIHAAGCAHYSKPTEGVLPSDMLRQCEGEDLKVGCNLTWGPCFDFQKQFFCGKVDAVSRYPYLLRYDIEVSGFGSHESGHLCLLRLKDQIYPGGDSDKHWPTLGLNTLRWAKKQGAICGSAHSGYGLAVEGAEIPSTNIPAYNGIGANEYIVDVTHEVPGPHGKLAPAVDFYSLCDTPYVWELTMWYHTLNVGFRTRCSGETDFPCISDERVGMGRSYVKLDGPLDFDAWCDGIRAGRSYASDGRSHLIDFKINGQGVGQSNSEVTLEKPGTVTATAFVAALLPIERDERIQNLPVNKKPFWHLERARIGSTREVPLEVIVNGVSVARTNILADGQLREETFQIPIERSSWVALRILGSSHSNPIWVIVDGKPLAPDRQSAEWCLKGVDQCWSQKKRFIKASEMEEAKAAYDHARKTYGAMLEQK